MKPRILVILTVIPLLIFACALPAATPALTATPVPTATFTPTVTPRPTVTPTPSPTPDPYCADNNLNTATYFLQADSLWAEFGKNDEKVAPKFDRTTGQFTSTTGLKAVSDAVDDLAKVQRSLEPVPMYKDYNEAAAKAMETYAQVLRDAVNHDQAKFVADRALYVIYEDSANAEWYGVYDYCGWTKPQAPSTEIAPPS